MKNLKVLKSLFIIMLSVGLILTISKVTFAADDDADFFSDLQAQNLFEDNGVNTNANNTNTNTSANNTNTNTNTKTNTNTNNTLNLTTNTNTSLNNTANLTANTTNRSVSNTNTLAKTGISDFSGLALVVVVAAISAIYSYKKVSDYRKI